MNLHLGTCGFTDAKSEYAQLFNCVEVQQTFYQPPRLATLERWRREVPAEFDFSLKAWQLITHSPSSPTYKRLKRNLSERERAEAGSFQPTPLVAEAWQCTRACAQALQAKTVLFQCPASFTQTPAHIDQLVQFFAHLERDGLICGWEPRGPWDKKVIKQLCETLQLWHVVDPFVQETMTPQHCYFRLHGRGGWRYRYEGAELAELVKLLPTDKPAYVFFNNVHMREDALIFKQLLQTVHKG